jgi:hypothetical protein
MISGGMNLNGCRLPFSTRDRRRIRACTDQLGADSRPREGQA